jgi:hypothetical protein
MHVSTFSKSSIAFFTASLCLLHKTNQTIMVGRYKVYSFAEEVTSPVTFTVSPLPLSSESLIFFTA